MADKKKSGITVMPEFVDGEQPTAYKFNTIGAQVIRASYNLELSVGDLWDQSYPYSSVSPARLSADLIVDYNANASPRVSGSKGRRLSIPNIGRVLGPSSFLNPIQLSYHTTDGTNLVAVEHQIVSENVPGDVHEFTLKYPPVPGTVSYTHLTLPTIYSL